MSDPCCFGNTCLNSELTLPQLLDINIVKKGPGLPKLVTNTDNVPGTLFPVQFLQNWQHFGVGYWKALVVEGGYSPKFMSSTQLSYQVLEDSLE